jgi:hypothetical protein
MENIKEQFARLYMELDLTDDQAAMIKKLQRDVDAALRQPMFLSMEEILRDAARRQAKYEVQYADYDLNTWTAPCQLTESRMERVLKDFSIRKVRLELDM